MTPHQVLFGPQKLLEGALDY